MAWLGCDAASEPQALQVPVEGEVCVEGGVWSPRGMSDIVIDHWQHCAGWLEGGIIYESYWW